ncbi:MAG: hypothetical protein PVF15_03735 [Candidatus Bathyarchaeota archaeon]|jgi:glycine cleavage system H protein
MGKVRKPKWKGIRVKQELVTAAKRTLETNHYRSLSEFVSEAIRLRLDELKQIHERTLGKQAESLVIPERLLYTSHHTWATVTPEGNTKIGLSYYAQSHLKGIAGIQTYPIGHEVTKGEPLGVIETWMFMFDLYSPVSGKIVRINEVIQDEPFRINEDPCELIWIVEVKPNNLVTLEEELRDLMRLSQYKMWVSKTARPRILSI